MHLKLFTHLIFHLNAAIDSGEYQDLSVAEIKSHIQQGDVVAFLKIRLGRAIDLSLIDDNAATDINDQLKSVLAEFQHHSQEQRRWGVVKSGLCLLVAGSTEIIQRELHSISDRLFGKLGLRENEHAA